jgi:hypothetical protein
MKIIIGIHFQRFCMFITMPCRRPEGRPAAASIRFFSGKYPGKSPVQKSRKKIIRDTIASAARPLRDVGGLAAPIRSARIRARTSVLLSGYFHRSGVNLIGSCVFQQS